MARCSTLHVFVFLIILGVASGAGPPPPDSYNAVLQTQTESPDINGFTKFDEEYVEDYGPVNRIRKQVRRQNTYSFVQPPLTSDDNSNNVFFDDDEDYRPVRVRGPQAPLRSGGGGGGRIKHPQNVRILKGDPADIIPQYVGTVMLDTPLSWQGPCFTKSLAYFNFTTKGGGRMTIDTEGASGTFCNEMYLFATSMNWTYALYFFRGKHIVEWPAYTPKEREDVLANGVRLLMFKRGMLNTLTTLYTVYKVVLTSERHPADVLDFYRKHAGIELPPRKDALNTIDESQIQSGDMFFLFVLVGSETGTVWITGVPVGHVAMALWIEGQLYIVETTREDESGMKEGVQKTPFQLWLARRRQLHYCTIWARLRPELHAKLDEKKAYEFFRKYEGFPFGYQTLAFAAFDTPEGNIPPPFTQDTAVTLMAIVSHIVPGQAKRFFFDGLNARLRNVPALANRLPKGWKNCTSFGCFYNTTAYLGLDMLRLAAIPERDQWEYELAPNLTGPALFCDAFVMHILRASGALDGLKINLTNIHFSEFTPKDVVQLQIYDEKWQPPAFCTQPSSRSFLNSILRSNSEVPGSARNRDDVVTKAPGFCQIMGGYEVPLPGFNSIPLYEHMNERCGAIPPKYVRTPPNC